MGEMYCLQCSSKIEQNSLVCPYCGYKYEYNKPFNYDEFKKTAKSSIKENIKKSKEKNEKGFTDEEILAMGLYPKDEGYKMSLISRILNKQEYD